MPILQEADALTIRDNFDKLPPDAKPKAQQWLKQYFDQQDEVGAAPFPSEVAKDQEATQSLHAVFEDPKKLDAENGLYDAADKVNPGMGDEMRYREANTRFLQRTYSTVPPDDLRKNFPLYRDDYALRFAQSKPGMTDGEFFNVAKGQLKKEADIQGRYQAAQQDGMKSALEGKETLEALAQTAMDNPDKEAESRAFFAAHRAVSDVMAKHQTLISTIADTVERRMMGNEQEGDAEKLAAAEDQVLDLPGSERRIVFGALRAQADERGKANVDAKEGGRGPMDQGKYMASFIQQMGESAGRFAENAITGNAQTQDFLNNTPENGEVRFSGKAITTPEDARKYVSESLMQQASTQRASGDIAPVPNMDGRNVVALDDRASALVRDAKARFEKKMRVQNELRQIGNATDPIPNLYASTIGSSGAIMGVMALSRGMASPTIFNAYSNVEYNDLSAKYPQMSHEDKSMVAAISGAAQTALDYVGVKGFAGLHVGKLLANPASLTTMLAVRGLGNAALSYGVENVVEGAQDIATPALIQALKLDVPGFDWEKEKEEFWKGRSDVAIGMLPLTLIGLGAASVNDYGNGKALLADNYKLGQIGIPEANRIATLEAAHSGDMDKAQTLFREGFAKRDPAIAAEFQAKLDEQQQTQQAANNELTRIGMLPDIQRDGDGYTVSADGQTAKFPTWDDARAAATQHMNENERHQADLVASMADSFIAGTPSTLPGGESFNIRQGLFSLADRVRSMQMTAEDAMEAAVAGGVVKGMTIHEARQIAQDVFGDSQEERTMAIRQQVENIMVLGRNKVQNGQSASTVNLGGNERAFLTVVEEAVEGRWNAALAAGRFNKAQGLSWVRLAEQATGEKFLEGMTHDEVAASTEASPRALTEAISRIVTADVLGRLQDGKRIGPGSVSRGLDLADREQSALATILNAFRQFFATILNTAAKLRKARQEGKLGAEYDQLYDHLTGDGTRWEHERGTIEAAHSITQHASGETFSVRPANLSEAESHLRALAGKEMTTADGLTGSVSNRSAAKMISSSAVKKSASPQAHLAAIGSFEELFTRGHIAESKTDRDNDPNITAIHRVNSSMELDGKDYDVKFTVKELARGVGNRIYSIEAVDVDAPPAGQLTHDAAEAANRDIPLTGGTTDNPSAPGQSQETHSLRAGDFQARVDKVFSDFGKTPEKRLTLMQVARARVQNEMDKLREILDSRAEGEQTLAEGEIRHAEAVSKLREDLEADEAQIRQDRDFELDAITQDKGNELDRERIRREADNELKKRRIQFERELAAVNERLSSGELKGAKAEHSNDRQKIKAILRVMEAAVSTLPIEVRGKIGKFSQILTMTDEKALNVVEAKIRKVDAEFEKHLKKELTAEVEKLLARGQPKAEAGKKAVGKDADMHALFAAAEAAQGMDADTVAGELAKIDAVMAGDAITPAQHTLLTTQRGLVELFGDWKNADAARMEAALETLRYIHTDRWVKWKLQEIERKERRAGMRHAFISGTGKEGTKNQRQTMEKLMATLLHWPKKIWLNLSSFGEVLNYSFGEHGHVNSLIDAEREASNQYEDEMQALGDEVGELFTSMAGSTLKGERLRFDMAQRTIKTATEELSQTEAITALLMWEQDDGRRHMEGQLDEEGKPMGDWHYDQAWIDELESKLTPEARQLMAWIKAKYGAEYATLNPLYRERYGVNMPGNKNYSPLSVKPMKVEAGEMSDPVTGAAMSSGSILTPGSLRTRSKNAIAEPDFKDALQMLIGHKKQMSYWKSYYDVLTEAQAILGNRKVMNAVEAKAGKEAAAMVGKWIKALAEGGVRDAAAGIEWTRFMNKAGGNAAVMALYGRIGTIAVQSTQLAATAMQMPVADYAVRLGKLMAGQLAWGDAIKSDFIQRRFKSAPPIVRQAMEQLANSSKPNVIKHLSNGLGKTLSGADALFTAGTYAILLDYHRALGAGLGLNGQALETHARTEAERATEEVAQPTRMANRSFIENAFASNPLARASFAYVSDARQKLVLTGWRLAKSPADLAKAALFLSISSLMAEVIRNGWKDAKGDDDEKKWSAERLAYAAVVKPLTAIPGLSEFSGDGSAFDGAKYGWHSAKDIYNGEGDAKDWMNLLKMAGYFNETAASLTGLANAGEEAAKVIVNLAD